MRMRIQWRLARRRLSYAFISVVGACATAPVGGPLPMHQVAELEARFVRDTADLDARIRLAAAYLRSGQTEQSLLLLEPVASGGRQAPAAVSFYLGITYEALGRFSEARRLYDEYLARGASPELVRRVQGRMGVLEQREAELAVRTALSREQESREGTPNPRVIAVLFEFATNQPMPALGRALAELLTTDLSQTDRLSIVPLATTQRLMREIRLVEQNSVDAQTLARAGRLLGAGRVIHMRLEGGESGLRLLAQVVPVVAAGSARTPPINHRGPLRDVITMEKTFVLTLFRALGVELNASERQRVARRATSSVRALLSFGHGLLSEEAGDHAQAVVHYRSALVHDAGLTPASVGLDRVQAQPAVATESMETLAAAGEAELGSRAASPPEVTRRRRFAGVERFVPAPSRRDPAAEVMGTEGIEHRGREIVIPRPGATR